MADPLPGKVIFSYCTLIDVMRHGMRFRGKKRVSVEVKGILTGTREWETVKATRAVPISHTKDLESPPDEEFYKKIKGYCKKHDVEIVGWYHSHPGIGPFFTRKDRTNHHAFLSLFKGTIALVIDPSKVRAGSQLGDYVRVFTLSNPRMGKNSPAMEIRNISVQAGFGDVVDSYVDMVGLWEKKQPLILELWETPDPGRVKRVKKVKEARTIKVTNDIEVIDSLSAMVLKLKPSLVKLKKEVDSHNGLEITKITREMKVLKLRQLSLFEKINHWIDRTSNIQTRIAMYKIRDSLSRDMRRLDDLINDQYINTLAELMKFGTNSSKEE